MKSIPSYSDMFRFEEPLFPITPGSHRGNRRIGIRGLKPIHQVGHFFQIFTGFLVVLEEVIGFLTGVGKQIDLDFRFLGIAISLDIMAFEHLQYFIQIMGSKSVTITSGREEKACSIIGRTRFQSRPPRPQPKGGMAMDRIFQVPTSSTRFINPAAISS